MPGGLARRSGVWIWRGFLAAIIVAWPVVASAGDTFKVAGDVPNPTEWTIDRLKSELAADITDVHYTVKGQQHTARGVALVVVLKAAGVDLSLKMSPKTDPKAKNHALRLAIVVRSGDGYTAMFSVGELLPEIGNRHAYLTFEVDGQPLPPREAPVNLIVPEDVMPGRWVRSVESIRVIESSEETPTTQPAQPDGGGAGGK